MNDDIHRAALRATAKVALSLTVLGCGGHVEIAASESKGEAGHGGAPPTPTSSSRAASTSSGRGGAGGTQMPGPMCDAATPGDPVTLDPGAFACCADWLPEQPAQSWIEQPMELVACCNELVGQIDLDPALMTGLDPSLVAPVWPDDGTPSCCDVLGNPCTAPCGCVVWGPPVPRGLYRALWSLAELEVA